MGEKMPAQQQRQVAVKVRISDIVRGRYVVEEGWSPNYVLTGDGRKVSRVNVLGVAISSPTIDANYRSITIDDGSGSIPVRSFDEADVFKEVSLGDAIFVIGRPRQYGNQVYIMPEIIKKVMNKAWIEVRKIEISKSPSIEPEGTAQGNPKTTDEPQFMTASEETVAEDFEEEPNEPAASPPEGQKKESQKQKVYSLIRELDNGDGAAFEEILEKSGFAEAEKVISQLLMEGEIFELGKGKLKVLE